MTESTPGYSTGKRLFSLWRRCGSLVVHGDTEYQNKHMRVNGCGHSTKIMYRGVAYIECPKARHTDFFFVIYIIFFLFGSSSGGSHEERRTRAAKELTRTMLPPVGSSLAPKRPHSRSRPSLFVFRRRPNFLDGAGEVPDGHVSTPGQDSRVAHKTPKTKSRTIVKQQRRILAARCVFLPAVVFLSCEANRYRASKQACRDVALTRLSRYDVGLEPPWSRWVSSSGSRGQEKEAGDYKRNELPPDYLPATSL